MPRSRSAIDTGADAAQAWLLRKQPAAIEGLSLVPRKNDLLPDSPLVMVRGQAQAFVLDDSTKQVWILKKFLPGRNPDARYIKAIQSLIPVAAGFESGYQRKVLASSCVSPSGYYTSDFSAWIENTILMPLVAGTDWVFLADQVREGKQRLTLDQRLLFCKALSERVKLLEDHGLSHRDLSSTNIFVDANSGNVHLIDWDSLYHQSLDLPHNSTFGSPGYIAPFVRINGTEEASATWRTGADRFSLALLNVEFLTVDTNSPLTGDGGVFEQAELYRSGGSGINRISQRLSRDFPQAAPLFERMLRAASFDECPSPAEWVVLSAGITAPSLKDIYDPQEDFLKFIEQLQRDKAKVLIAAPSLADVEWPKLTLPASGRNAPPAPRLDEVELPIPLRVPPNASSAMPAAPRLSEIEKPFGGGKPVDLEDT